MPGLPQRAWSCHSRPDCAKRLMDRSTRVNACRHFSSSVSGSPNNTERISESICGAEQRKNILASQASTAINNLGTVAFVEMLKRKEFWIGLRGLDWPPFIYRLVSYSERTIDSWRLTAMELKYLRFRYINQYYFIKNK